VTDRARDAGQPPAAARWAAAVARSADGLARSVATARAGGASDAQIAEALRATGPAFERWLDRQPAVAASTATTDAWALGWATVVLRLVPARRYAEGSLARWVVDWVVPALVADVRDLSPSVVGDLVESATRLWGHADLTAWARGLEAGLRAWPTDTSLTDDLLRALGAVAAWRAGHVRLRAAASQAAEALPDVALTATLQVDAEVRETLRRNATHPVWWPDGGGDRRIGAFRAFGGAWTAPPVVVGGDGLRWDVRAGGDAFTVVADAFGDTVLPAGPAGDVDPAPAPEPWWSRHGEDVTGAARAAGAVLMSTRWSHRLTLRPDESAGGEVGG
jgi:hypothetical protein